MPFHSLLPMLYLQLDFPMPSSCTPAGFGFTADRGNLNLIVLPHQDMAVDYCPACAYRGANDLSVLIAVAINNSLEISTGCRTIQWPSSYSHLSYQRSYVPYRTEGFYRRLYRSTPVRVQKAASTTTSPVSLSTPLLLSSGTCSLNHPVHSSQPSAA